ncbi:hypothetical protein N2152v2_006792 [Parachlorella kessleri]
MGSLEGKSPAKMRRLASQALSSKALAAQGSSGWCRLLLLTALLMAALFAAWHALAPPSPSYILVIDAGSSGTRLYAYTWQPGQHPGAPPIVEAIPPSAAAHKVPRRAMPAKRAYQRVETEPGLDQFVGDERGLRAKSLGPLLGWAKAVVPRHQRRRTPVFLYATAGLRTLPDAQQDVLMNGVRGVLQRSSFRFEESWARIISGEDEGIYGWIALNYLAGSFGRLAAPHARSSSRSGGVRPPNLPQPFLDPAQLQALFPKRGHVASEDGMEAGDELTGAGEGAAGAATGGSGGSSGARARRRSRRESQTLGVLDLGGSSLEVAFELEQGMLPAEEVQRLSKDTVNVTVLGSNYQLYVHVHHHYGLNDAFDRSVSHLMEASGSPARALPSPVVTAAAGNRQGSSPTDDGSGTGSNGPGSTSKPREGSSEAGSGGNRTSGSSSSGAGGSSDGNSSRGGGGGDNGKGNTKGEASVEPAVPSSNSVGGGALQRSVHPDSTEATSVQAQDERAARLAADMAAHEALHGEHAKQAEHRQQGDGLGASGGSGDASPGSSNSSRSSSRGGSSTGSVGLRRLMRALLGEEEGGAALAATAAQVAGSRRVAAAQVAGSRAAAAQVAGSTAAAAAQVAGSSAAAAQVAGSSAAGTDAHAAYQLLAAELAAEERLLQGPGSSAGSHRAVAELPNQGGRPMGVPLQGQRRRQLLAGGQASGAAGEAGREVAQAAGGDGQEGLSNRDGGRSPKDSTGSGGKEGESTAISSPAPDSAGASSGGSDNTTSAAGGRAPSPSLLSVAHPCLHAGYAKPYRRLRVGGRDPHPAQVLLLGRPDHAACAELAGSVVNASAACGSPSCALGAAQPHTKAAFTALTGFYVVYHFFGLHSKEDRERFPEVVRDFCGKPWQQVERERADEIHVDRYCFRAPFITALLGEGLRVPPDRVLLGSPSVAWTLGAALAEGSRLGIGGPAGSDLFLPRSSLLLARRLGHRSAGLLLAGAGALLLLAAAVLAGRRPAGHRRAGSGGAGAKGAGAVEMFSRGEPGNADGGRNGGVSPPPYVAGRGLGGFLAIPVRPTTDALGGGLSYSHWNGSSYPGTGTGGGVRLEDSGSDSTASAFSSHAGNTGGGGPASPPGSPIFSRLFGTPSKKRPASPVPARAASAAAPAWGWAGQGGDMRREASIASLARVSRSQAVSRRGISISSMDELREM